MIEIRVGYRLAYECPQPTPMLLTLAIHYSRASDVVGRDNLTTWPAVPIQGYRDGFGNWINRVLAPAGRIELSSMVSVRDSGLPDPYVPDAWQQPVESLPEEVLVYLLGSRYCDTDQLSNIAWDLFGHTQPGWGRVQAICDFVHDRIRFNYQNARSTRTAFDGYNERTGVCRDFAHLAVTFCRCMNIPARYCTGYLGDIGVPLSPDPMDFSAWFQVWLSGGWHTFDARHNVPRIGRVLMATGRDATDVAISTSFGPSMLAGFEVTCEQIG